MGSTNAVQRPERGHLFHMGTAKRTEGLKKGSCRCILLLPLQVKPHSVVFCEISSYLLELWEEQNLTSVLNRSTTFSAWLLYKDICNCAEYFPRDDPLRLPIHLLRSDGSQGSPPPISFSRSSFVRCGLCPVPRNIERPNLAKSVKWLSHDFISRLHIWQLCTETANKDGMWLREISSCCCLTTGGKTRQLLLNNIYIPFLPFL